MMKITIFFILLLMVTAPVSASSPVGECPENPEEAAAYFGGIGLDYPNQFSRWEKYSTDLVPERYCAWKHLGMVDTNYLYSVPEGNFLWTVSGGYLGPQTVHTAIIYSSPEMWLGDELPKPEITLKGPSEAQGAATYHFKTAWGEATIFYVDRSIDEASEDPGCTLMEEKPFMWNEGTYFVCTAGEPHKITLSSATAGDVVVKIYAQLGGYFNSFNGPRIIATEEMTTTFIGKIFLPMINK